MKDIDDIMNILAKEKSITVDRIIELLDNSRDRRWVVSKANRLCYQYPKHFTYVMGFNPETRKKYVKGFKNLKLCRDEDDHIFLR